MKTVTTTGREAELTITLERPGRGPLDLTPLTAPRFTTNAVGGYGSCTLPLPGGPDRWRNQIPYLSTVRILHGPRLLYEGRIEDIAARLSGSEFGTSLQAFGLRRLLEDTSIRRIWSKRDLGWREDTAVVGVTDIAANPLTRRGDLYATNVGQVDVTDLTKTGVEIRGNESGTTAVGACMLARWDVPAGITLTRLMGDFTINGGGHEGIFEKFNGATWASMSTDPTGNTTINESLSGITAIRYGMAATSIFSISSNYYSRFLNVRALATSLTEDTAGGFYGGTILRDLIALIPGLSVGDIETGSDFTIQAIERAVRNTAGSVVNEVAGYYTREWGVWEDGRFDWAAPNLDEPQWITELADLSDLEITGSVDGLARTAYVLYTDAASDTDAEQSAASTDQRNPFVKQGRTKDTLVSPGFPMTSLSAAQLATRLAADSGMWPPVQGRITLPARTLIRNATGSRQPAYTIRGGDNILIADLPKTDVLQPGRDGETLFHIVSTDTDLAKDRVTLELEGQTRRADILLARLAAATRVLTG